MIYLFLAILGSGLIPVLFRAFADWRINLFWAIPTNYMTCILVGSLWAGHPLAPASLPGRPWFPLAVFQGVILAVNFFLLAYTAQRAGVSVAALASRLSVAIPSLLAFLIYGDSLNIVKISGLVGALLSLYLCTAPEMRDSPARPLASKFLPVLVFLTFGCYFIVIKYAQARYLDESSYHAYVMTGFLFACLTSVLIAVARGVLAFADCRPAHMAAGLILGAVNYIAVYALVKALALEGWQSSELYPIYSVGVVALSTLLAMMFFRERLSRKKTVGLLIGVIAVALLNR